MSASGEDRITVVSQPNTLEDTGDCILHLVQDELTIAKLHQCVLPPDAYYTELAKLWEIWWPKANPDLLEHMMSIQIASDTATAFAMSFGIAKFGLAQEEATFVGEIVSKYGRRQ